jgi:hypothetical protein
VFDVRWLLNSNLRGSSGEIGAADRFIIVVVEEGRSLRLFMNCRLGLEIALLHV